jgi:hypothetical protein
MTMRLIIVAAASLGLAACHHNQPQQYAQNQVYAQQAPVYAAPVAYLAQPTEICVDRNSGVRVSEQQCHYGSGGMSPFVWYYLGAHAIMPYYGQHFMGGSYYGQRGVRYGIPSPAYRRYAPTVNRTPVVGRSGPSGINLTKANPTTIGGINLSKTPVTTYRAPTPTVSYRAPSYSAPSVSYRPSTPSYSSARSFTRSGK